MSRNVAPLGTLPLAGNRVAPSASVFAGYALLSLALFCRSTDWRHSVLAAAPADPWSYIWLLNWWPWSLLHGQFGQTTHYVFAPYGYDLAWATPIPTAALLVAPLTLTLGAAVAYNALSLLAPALAASSAFLLIRRGIGGSLAAGTLGGALFGFSPYEVGQMSGHLNLDLCFVPPLICLAVLARLAGRLGRGGFVAGLVCLLLMQFGVSSEVFATTVTLGGGVWLLFAALSPRSGRMRHARVAIEAGGALVLTVTVLSPVLLTMARDAADFPDFINQPWMFSTNLLNLIVPTQLAALGGRWLAPVSFRFSGNPAEQGGYIGLPMLAVLVLLARERRGNRAIIALLLALIGLVVASLGPSLHAGRWDSHVPMPWWVATHLPLLQAALPSRISLYAALAGAVAAALWLDGAITARGRRLRLATLGLCLLTYVPAPGQATWLRLPLVPFFEPATARAALGPDATILLLPYAAGPAPVMLWQWQSGMSFRQASGYLSFVPMSAGRLQFVQHLIYNEPSAHFANDLAGFVSQSGITAVLAAPGTSPALRRALSGLGWVQGSIGGVDVFRVPPTASLRYASLRGDVWYAHGEWSLMGHGAEVVTHGRAATLELTEAEFPTGATTVTLQRPDGTRTAFPVGAHGSLSIKLPADGTFHVGSAATFVPRRVLPHNADPRELSFYVRLVPN